MGGSTDRLQGIMIVRGPQLCTALDAIHIRDEGDIRIEVNRNPLCISTTDVQVIVIKDSLQRCEDLAQASIPLLLADLLKSIVADELVISLSARIRMLTNLQVRKKHTIHQECCTKPGT